MTLKYDAEGMAFPDDFSFIPSECLEQVILDTPKGWNQGEYEVCSLAADADRRSEVFIDGEPPLPNGSTDYYAAL